MKKTKPAYEGEFTVEDLKRGPLAWVADQKERFLDTPSDQIDVNEMELVADVEYYVLQKIRKLAGKKI